MSGKKFNKHDFLPEDYHEKKMERRTNFICLVLFMLVMAGVAGAYFITNDERQEVRALQQKVNASYTEAARRIEQLNELQAKKEAMLRKAKTTGTLVELVPRSFLLADLINRMPKNMSVFEFSLASKVSRISIASINKKQAALKKAKSVAGKNNKNTPEEPKAPKIEVTMSMTGVAPTDIDVAQYMSKLSTSQLLNDLNLVYSEEKVIQDSKLRRFRIDMQLSETADVRQLDPLRLKRIGSSSNVGIAGGGADVKRTDLGANKETEAKSSSAGAFFKNIFKRRQQKQPEDVADAVQD